ncbi:MAG TPA: gamma-glutamyl-gamma-aminobutyrate hydrolase family protein [Thermoanaerobaculia bacterium]|nr:gamma-glutamyl-gamma-aminobutyrate hydrolase family protein [Thermoanaerobaculia bacterium]
MTKPLIGIGADVRDSGSRHGEQASGQMSYIQSLLRAGAIPLLVPPQPENIGQLLESLDGVLLTGGRDCDPSLWGEECHASFNPMDVRRQENDLALARGARQLGVPALGVCLGMQIMSIAAGGSLIQDIRSEIESGVEHENGPEGRRRHEVRIEEKTILSSIVGGPRLEVNSSHHQAVRTAGEGLRITAWAPDGIAEAVEDGRLPFYIGLQWHPEDMTGEDSAERIIHAFVAAAGKRADSRTLHVASAEQLV